MAAKAGSADYDPRRIYVGEMDPPETILGSPVSKLQWGCVVAAAWLERSLPVKVRQVQTSDVQTLLLSGTVDFSTPAKFATDELLAHLTHGSQVIMAEAGHTEDLWHLQPQATKHLLASFYDSGAVDGSPYTYVPMDFHVFIGFRSLQSSDWESPS